MWKLKNAFRKRSVPPALIDLTAPAFFADPYPVYEVLRRQHAIVPAANGGHILLRHADILEALSDDKLGNAPSRFSALAAKNKARHVAAAVASRIPPFLDMPDLKIPRTSMSRAFHKTFGQFQPTLDALASAAMPGAYPADLVSEIARPYALSAMSAFTGVEASHTQLKTYTDAFFRLFAPLNDAEAFAQTNARLAEFRKCIRDALERRRQERKIDFLSNMLAYQEGEAAVTEDHIIDATLLVFADGIENIEAGCALAFEILSGIPVQDLTENHVIEALRLQTPAQILPRVARVDHVRHGVDIKQGQGVFLALGSANRDPEAYASADMFDPARDNSKALIFGRGVHQCIGRPLALAQILTLCRALCEAGAKPADHAASKFAQRFGHRWPVAMLVSK